MYLLISSYKHVNTQIIRRKNNYPSRKKAVATPLLAIQKVPSSIHSVDKKFCSYFDCKWEHINGKFENVKIVAFCSAPPAIALSKRVDMLSFSARHTGSAFLHSSQYKNLKPPCMNYLSYWVTLYILPASVVKKLNKYVTMKISMHILWIERERIHKESRLQRQILRYCEEEKVEINGIESKFERETRRDGEDARLANGRTRVQSHPRQGFSFST